MHLGTVKFIFIFYYVANLCLGGSLIHKISVEEDTMKIVTKEFYYSVYFNS